MESQTRVMNVVGIVGFLLLVALILFAVVAAITGYLRNKKSPMVNVPARVVAKRSEVSGGGSANSYVRTTFYITFESKDGERREWAIDGQQFGLLAEGDRGTLIYQGDWFKDFRRNVS